MSRKIEDFPNVTAPNSDYPYGDVKDNTGSNNGTPVSRLTFGDVFQFFNRLMALAAVAANGLPDNNANGFQFITALTNFTNALITTAVNAEAASRAAADVTLQNDKANRAQGSWTSLTSSLQNGWAELSDCAFRINQFGRVELKGSLTAVGSSSGIILNAAVLPIPENVNGVRYTSLRYGDPGQVCIVYVTSAGGLQITENYDNIGGIDLDNISYYPQP